MNPKKPNWQLWGGFVLSLTALPVYFALVTTTRSVFWLSVALFAAALVLLISGLWRAYGQAETYRGKIAGPILTVCLALMMGIFGLSAWVVSKAFPAARNAPQPGQKAPEFVLADSAGQQVSMAQLLSSPITDASGAAKPVKGLLVVFYRGYW
ncbi:MAG TPA: hypothetical protein VKT33_08240 [Candidatus Angelobacter sp.]|nr:hypothetical protein [Candidatus Angelobacter sp.]